MTNTTYTEPTQCNCGAPADGLGWGMCQGCWEKYSAGQFWRIVPTLIENIKDGE